jgi:hypothetical protein
MTDKRELLLSLIEPMAKLNSWARLPYEERSEMYEATDTIYAFKRRIIAAAIKLGTASLRLVAVERPCKTCKGTGQYEWVNWHDEDDRHFEDCRRCNDTGKVTLRFVESTIAGQRWHTPRPKWDLGIFTPTDWEKCEPAGDWEPERPGKSLGRIELIEALNAVERVLLPPLVPYEHWPHSGSLAEKRPRYGLHLGKIRTCPFCGQKTAGMNEQYGPCHTIYRPLLRWEQDHCWGDRHCAEAGTPLQWPHDLNPPRGGINDRDQWEYHVALPELAYHPAVTEWLARRGIRIGSYPPDECVYSNGATLLKVVAARETDLLVRIYDSQRLRWPGCRSLDQIRMPARIVHAAARAQRCPARSGGSLPSSPNIRTAAPRSRSPC